MSARRWLVLTTATIATLMAVSVLVVALRPGPSSFDPDSPEGTVQRFVAAVIADDLLAARALFAAELADRCSDWNFSRRWWGRSTPEEHVRLLESASLSGDRVRVTVSVEQTHVDPPFGVSVMETTHIFVVTREADAWRIVSFDWPNACRR